MNSMSKHKNRGENSRTPNQMMLRRTLVLLSGCGIVAFLVLGIRLFQIQILQHEYYESLAIEQQVRGTRVSASRGTIYDRNKKILAMSASVESIYISPAEIKMYDEDPALIAQGLAEILDVDPADILEKAMDTSSWYKTIKSKVEQDVADKVREFKNANKLKGVKIEADTKRYYPYSSLAAHTVGFVGTDNYGLGGIELRYNSVLTGTDGRIVRAKNAAGTDMLFTKFEDYYDAENGNDVVLSIDSTIQYYVEKHLEQAVKDYDVQNGAAAIAMNPKTGELLAMASIGKFDLNNFQLISDEAQAKIDEEPDESKKNALLAKAQQLQWRNKALSDTYEPGSTFKIITLAMALEEGKVSKNDAFYCGGSRDVLGRTEPVSCWKTIGHGSQTLTQAVQHSCNVAFVDIGMRVGYEAFYKYAEAFGFFERTGNVNAQLSGKTGIDLDGESGSIWWPENVFCDSKNLSQLAAASFGQTFNITPLQLVTAISACVNGGDLMQPYIVREIIGPDGDMVSKTEPTVLRQVISEDSSAVIRELLEAVVGDKTEGTGKNAYVAGYRIGGKTGTSEKVAQIAAGQLQKEYIVSFVGVAPIDDPQIVILTLLDTPSEATGIYISGGQMGAPTVGKMLADILPYMGIEAQFTEEELGNMDKTVPNVAGLSLDEATGILQQQYLAVRTVGAGNTVTAQLPAANQVIAKDSQVILYLGAEPSDEEEEMPDLTGLTYSIARQRLGYYGLFIKCDTGGVLDAETVVVTAQSVEPGVFLEHGAVVTVTLADTDTSMLGRY